MSDNSSEDELRVIRDMIEKSVKEAAEADLKNGKSGENSRENLIERAIDAARDDVHG